MPTHFTRVILQLVCIRSLLPPATFPMNSYEKLWRLEGTDVDEGGSQPRPCKGGTVDADRDVGHVDGQAQLGPSISRDVCQFSAQM